MEIFFWSEQGRKIRRDGKDERRFPGFGTCFLLLAKAFRY